eukprot:858487_1
MAAFLNKKIKPMFIFLSLLIIIITIWVWRTENISFSESEKKEHIPQIHLLGLHNPEIKIKKPKHMHDRNKKSHKFADINQLKKQDSKYGIHTAPYDLSDLHIYGLNEYCTHKYMNKIEYMDVTGMYDTG